MFMSQLKCLGYKKIISSVWYKFYMWHQCKYKCLFLAYSYNMDNQIEFWMIMFSKPSLVLVTTVFYFRRFIGMLWNLQVGQL